MEKRLVIAVVLTLGVILLTNILFPPAKPPPGEVSFADSATTELTSGDTVSIAERLEGPDPAAADAQDSSAAGIPAAESPDALTQPRDAATPASGNLLVLRSALEAGWCLARLAMRAFTDPERTSCKLALHARLVASRSWAGGQPVRVAG